MDLNGQRVVVLGGSSGIGLAVAQAAGRAAASVVIASSRQSRIAAALASLPDGTEGHALDLADEQAVRGLFARLGAFDHLVFTAGGPRLLGMMAEMSVADAKRTFDLRYFGAWMAAKYGSPGIRPGGSIVFTSGTAGRRPRAGWAVGASICMAMEGLTRALAVELAPIRVNLVVPGLVKTPLWDGMSGAAREEMYAASAARLPVGHAGEAAEVAEAYLAFMRQSYCTGQTMVVDGGGVLV